MSCPECGGAQYWLTLRGLEWRGKCAGCRQKTLSLDGQLLREELETNVYLGDRVPVSGFAGLYRIVPREKVALPHPNLHEVPV